MDYEGWLAVIALSTAFITIWWMTLNNKFIVEPNNRERLVIENFITGHMVVLGPGTHIRPLWYRERERVNLNREPIHVPSGGGDGEEVRTTDGIIGLVEYRYDIITGRAFHPDTGQLINPDTRKVIDNPDKSFVTDAAVLLAVTKIDFADRQKRVQGIISSSVEDEVGSLSAQQAFRPSEAAVTLNAMPEFGIPAKTVIKAADLYADLSLRINARANKKLTFVGLNVVDVEITNLKPKLQATQEAIERQEQLKRIGSGAAAMVESSAKDGSPVSYREALVAHDPTALGEVSKAEATRFQAKQYADAAQVVAEAIRDGLKKFGKG